ncbi:hypothetical protein BC827DRAFT_1171801 [Russula dissimulans]|nr:hypothetical protein BC827DRAFT_1171801 [Russula dissimulans]
MVALTPRFTILATFCALAAISSAPISDAAVLHRRTLDPASMEKTSTHTRTGIASLFSRRSSYVAHGGPVLPLPKGHGASQKDYGDSPGSSDTESDEKTLSGSRHEETDVSAGAENEDSSYEDNGVISKKAGKFKAKDRRWNPFLPLRKMNDYVYHARAPHHDDDHHHHHHHHHHYRRVLMTRGRAPGHDSDSAAPVISADKSVVHPRSHHYGRVGRSPHHPHHHHHHGNGYDKVIVSGDNDRVILNRSPRPHHHHDHNSEHEKVVISGDHPHVHVDRSEDEGAITYSDNDHVHRQRSVVIVGEQGQPYVVPRVTKRSTAQELFTIPRSRKRADHMDGASGRIDIMSPSDAPAGATRIASLVLSPMSENSTTPSSEFVLNASDMNATQIYLHASSFNSSNITAALGEIGVTLRMAMFDVTSASVIPYCATFDPAPSAPAPLKAEKCTEDPVGERKSQLFAFHPASGTVRPMWFETQNDEKDSEGNGCNDHAQSVSQPNVTEVGSSQAVSSTSADQDPPPVLTADPSQVAPSNSSDDSISGAQSVVLMFVASDPEIEDVPADASETSSPVPATTTGTEASNTGTTTEASSTTTMASSTPGSLVSASPTAQVTSSSMGSVSPVMSSGAPTSVPSPTAMVPEANSATPMELGVQVVPESASDVISTISASATPIMTPVSTAPYEWTFTPDSS